MDNEVKDILSWAHTSGIVVYNPEAPHLIVAPITVRPSPYKAADYRAAEMLAAVFGELVDRISCDVAWLCEVLEKVGALDPFTGRLVELARRVYLDAGRVHREEQRLHILRQDYLQHKDEGIRLVEVNTISAAFAGLIEKLGDVHEWAVRKYHPQLAANVLAGNKPCTEMAEAIAAAHLAYSQKYPGSSSPIVLYVVHHFPERNMVDQVHLELALHRKGVTCIRRAMKGLTGQFSTEGGRLMIKDDSGALQEVAVVYYRSAYGPECFEDDAWDVREAIEMTRAIKCPSIPSQLAGTKKVQQLLCDPAVLERFAPDHRKQLEACFVPQVDPSATDDQTKACVADAVAHPERWVLKPQREGGGNNLHGEQLSATLKAGGSNLGEFVLMQRIVPVGQESVIVDRSAAAPTAKVIPHAVSELGIYSATLYDGEQVKLNTKLGHLLRTKDSSTDEGGVNSGFSCLDSPILV